MNTFAELAKQLKDALAQEKKKPSGYDTTATVTRVEDGVVWVHIPGGVDETPVRQTIAASAGDEVQVRVDGGRAWLVGNATAPPTDDKRANQAYKLALRAGKTVKKIYEKVESGEMDGEDGLNARQIVSIVQEWCLATARSLSGDQTFEDIQYGDWEEELPEMPETGTYYYWTRTVTTYDDDTQSITDPIFDGSAQGSYEAKQVSDNAWSSAADAQAIANQALRASESTGRALTNFVSTTYASDMTDLQSQIDGKAETWWQTTDPASRWLTDEEKSKHVGDLWYNPSTGITCSYVKTQSGTYFLWAEQTVPLEVFDEIDGKSSIYTGSATPTDPEEGDLWLKSANDDILTYVGGSWIKYNKYTDDTAVNALKNYFWHDNAGAHVSTQEGSVASGNSVTVAANGIVMMLNGRLVTSWTGTDSDSAALNFYDCSNASARDIDLMASYARSGIGLYAENKQVASFTKSALQFYGYDEAEDGTVTKRTEASFNAGGVDLYAGGDVAASFRSSGISFKDTIPFTIGNANSFIKWVFEGGKWKVKICADEIVMGGTAVATQDDVTGGGIWYNGTAITGTSTTPTVFSNSGIDYANEGDMYINSDTNDIYRCETEGDPDTAEWSYAGNLEGDDGHSSYTYVRYSPNANGSNMTTTPTGTTKYIGVYTGDSETVPWYGDFTWSKYIGDDGKGISSTSVTYQAGTSATTAPTGTWQSSPPSVSQGQYLWTKIVTTYTDSTSTTAYSVARQGQDGAKGEDVTSQYMSFSSANGLRIYSGDKSNNTYNTSYTQIKSSGIDLVANNVNLAHIGYGLGTDSNGSTTTTYAPYYTFGTRNTTTTSGSTTMGNYSAAIGVSNVASGYCSFAAGGSSQATGNTTFAMGFCAVSSNQGALAIGCNTKTGRRYQFVCGLYNKGSTNNLFEIGNGTGTADAYRKNIFEVSDSGNVTLSGKITTGGHSSAVGSIVETHLSSSKSVSNDTLTNILSLTLPAGTWVVCCGVRFANNSVGYRKANLSTSSSDDAAQIMYAASDSAAINAQFTRIVTHTSSTTYYLNVRQTSGSAMTMPSTSTNQLGNFITAIRIV